MTTDNTTAKLLNDLLRELASEVDLHYDDRDMHALANTIAVMKAAATAIRANGSEPPEVCLHVLRRFEAVAKR